MVIRESAISDLPELLAVGRQAFGDQEGPEIVELIKGLLADPSAKPLLSLVALDHNRVVGHILFTRAIVSAHEEVSASILAPLAVLPAYQKQGIGGRLIKAGLDRLAGSGVKIVFVLGHPDYYPRFGFEPAGVRGLQAPYPIPEEISGAWMVRELSFGFLSRIEGTVKCAAFMDRPEYWRE